MSRTAKSIGLPSLYAKKLACCNFSYGGRRYAMPRSQIKDFVTPGIRQYELCVCIGSLRPLTPNAAKWMSPSGCYHGTESQLKNSECGQTYLIFASEEEIVLIVLDKNKPVFCPQVDTVSIFQGCILYKNLWKVSTKQKLSMFLLTRHVGT